MPLNVRDRLGLGFGHSGGEALGVLGDDFAVFLGLLATESVDSIGVGLLWLGGRASVEGGAPEGSDRCFGKVSDPSSRNCRLPEVDFLS